jgi:hypothetical protein
MAGGEQKASSEQLEQYPWWNGEGLRLVEMTYAFRLEDFPNSIETPRSVALIAEDNERGFVLARMALTSDLLDAMLNSSGVSFGFLISKDGQTPAGAEISSQKHLAKSSVAAVSFFTRLDDSGKEKIRSFVEGCDKLK